MATRVNTKFVLVLTVAVLGAVGTIGLLAVLKIRGDTTRPHEKQEPKYNRLICSHVAPYPRTIPYSLRYHRHAKNLRTTIKDACFLRYNDRLDPYRWFIRQHPHTADKAA